MKKIPYSQASRFAESFASNLVIKIQELHDEISNGRIEGSMSQRNDDGDNIEGETKDLNVKVHKFGRVMEHPIRRDDDSEEITEFHIDCNYEGLRKDFTKSFLKMISKNHTIVPDDNRIRKQGIYSDYYEDKNYNY